MDSENATRRVETAKDIFIITLESVERRVQETIADLTDGECHWEPLTGAERLADMQLPPGRKQVWRVFQQGGMWTYDYTPEPLQPPPFTTIAWILNHMAQTGDMYLYCVRSGKPEGIKRRWDDLPVHPNCERLDQYIQQVLEATKAYLNAIPTDQIILELNRPTPAPWGEIRPAYKNVWGGIIGHCFEHVVQIAVIKQNIRGDPGAYSQITST